MKRISIAVLAASLVSGFLLIPVRAQVADPYDTGKTLTSKGTVSGLSICFKGSLHLS